MDRLLIHTVVYYAVTGRDRDGNPTYAAPVTLADVRAVPVLATAEGSTGASKDDRLTVYIKGNSAVVPAEGDRIEWDGGNYTVRQTAPMYARVNTVHHYEVYLT